MIWQELNQNCNTFLVNLIVNCLQPVGSLSQEAAERRTQNAEPRRLHAEVQCSWSQDELWLPWICRRAHSASVPSTASASYVFTILAVAASGITREPAKTAKGGTVSHRLPFSASGVDEQCETTWRPLPSPVWQQQGKKDKKPRSRNNGREQTPDGLVHIPHCGFSNTGKEQRNRGTREQGKKELSYIL